MGNLIPASGSPSSSSSTNANFYLPTVTGLVISKDTQDVNEQTKKVQTAGYVFLGLMLALLVTAMGVAAAAYVRPSTQRNTRAPIPGFDRSADALY
jgi:hypothetical protein